MKTLIINLATALGSSEHSHIKDYEKVEKEYLSKPFNSNIDVFIFLFISNSVRLELLTKKLVFKDNLNQFEKYDYPEDLDIGSPKDLAQLFTILVKKEQYSKKILSTWDHGYGYFMFFEQITNNDYIHFEKFALGNTFDDYKSVFDNIKFRADKTGNKNLSFFLENERMNLLRSEFELTLLSMNELKDAIQNSELKKFDLIIMSNCYMQTVDTAYALKDCANYLIAPQTVFPWESYDYGSLLKIDEFSDFQDYCKNILKNSFDKIPKNTVNPTTEVIQKEVALTLINLKNAGEFFSALQGIIKFLLDFYKFQDDSINFSKEITNVAVSCNDVTDFEKIYMIDLLNFLYKLNLRFFKYDEFFIPYEKLRKIQVVLFIKKGDLFSDIGVDNKIVSSGMSINFPLSKSGKYPCQYFDLITRPNAPLVSLFSKETKWGLFLEKFLP